MSTENGTVVSRARRDAALRRGRDRGRRAPRRLRRGPARAADRGDGPVGLRQVDADAHPRGPRQADVGLGRDRRDGDHDAEGLRPDEAPARPHRLRLPVLQPPADADGRGEHHAAALDRGREAREGVLRRAHRLGRARATASRTAPPSSPAASSSASRSPGRSSRSPTSSSRTSRRATSTRRRAPRSSSCCAHSVEELGQTIVMVTHEARAAAIADRVLYLADGQIVRELAGARASTRSRRRWTRSRGRDPLRPEEPRSAASSARS